MKLATRLLEETIAHVGDRPDTRRLCEPPGNSWEIEFSDLSVFNPIRSSDDKINVCIATEDIVGPIRNGGIGTTYSLLSRLLADNDFNVTILYLRGDYVENESIEHWIEYYGKYGVEFLPVPDYLAGKNCSEESKRWIAPMYNMYRYLQDHQFDIVHVSEWRGSGYLSLLAKDIGVDFKDTHFVVKCSSPWLWNRLYGNHTIKNPTDVLKIFCEKRSVELGDHVVGGSAHLLRWMISQGYQVNHNNTFVQPNVVVVDHLKKLAEKRLSNTGQRVKIEEIVFFGRLESRKGLTVFCDAVDRLCSLNVSFPEISFMGKVGARIDSNPELSIIEYINHRSSKWDCKVNLLTNFQQEEAITYLLSGNRLAVMPSLIENSSLAVYEAVICGIPFVASNSGGTSELIDQKYHGDCLCDPHPVPLTIQLESALNNGGIIAECSFDNDKNNETWVAYHHYLGSREPNQITEVGIEIGAVDVFVYYNGDGGALSRTLNSLCLYRTSNFNMVVIDDVSFDSSRSISGNAELAQLVLNCEATIISTGGYDRGFAYNIAVEKSTADAFIFLRASDTVSDQFFVQVYNALSRKSESIVTSFVENEHINLENKSSAISTEVVFPIVGDLSTMFYEINTKDIFISLTRDIFEKVGGFTGDYGVGSEIAEFINGAALNGIDIVTIPEILLKRVICKELTSTASGGRAIRSFYKYAPQAYRNIFMVAKGQAERLSFLEGKVQSLRIERDRVQEIRRNLHTKNQDLRDELRFARAANGRANKSRGGELQNLPVADLETVDSMLKSLQTTDSDFDTGLLDQEIPIGLIHVDYMNEKEIKGCIGLCVDSSTDLKLVTSDMRIIDCVVTYMDGFPQSKRNRYEFTANLSPLSSAELLKGELKLVLDDNESTLGSIGFKDKIYTAIEGAIDGFNVQTGHVRGWLWDRNVADECVAIDVYWDDSFLRTVYADAYQEFRRNTMKDPEISEHGVSFKLPASLLDGKQHSLKLRVRNTMNIPKRCAVSVDTSTGNFQRIELEAVSVDFGQVETID